MTVVIDSSLCNGCKDAREPLCVRICPGDLFYRAEKGRAKLRRPEECWDCASCIKVCPKQAISLTLPIEAGGTGGRITARKEKGQVRWYLISPNGEQIELTS